MVVYLCCHRSQGLLNDLRVLQDIIPDAETKVYEESHINSDIVLSNPSVIILIEHLVPSIIKSACKKNCKLFFIPNVEWLSPSDANILKNNPNIVILSKTKSSNSACCQLFPSNINRYIGWTSVDRSLEMVVKCHSRWLHVRGVSKYKNTQMIIDVWLDNPTFPHLTVVANGLLDLPLPLVIAHNLTIIQNKLSESELTILMNQCSVHVCPSFSEGFGHYINEARSSRSLVITTDCSPMNELVNEENGTLIVVDKIVQVRLGLGAVISKKDLKNAVLNTFKKNYGLCGNNGRMKYFLEKEEFVTRLLNTFINE